MIKASTSLKDASASPFSSDRHTQLGQPQVVLRKVSQQYQLGEVVVNALRQIDLEIRQGEFVGIWGPSGSGKTSLMNIIGLVDTPRSGEVAVDGCAVGSLSDARLADFRNQKIGYIFQTFNLIPVFTALENVTIPLQIRGTKPSEARALAAARLEEVGLTRFKDFRPDKLSGGQRQRVAIARALVGNPLIVIADEPTANLDSENGRMVVEIMQELNRTKGITFILTTHDPRVLDHVHRKIKVEDGSIVEDILSSS